MRRLTVDEVNGLALDAFVSKFGSLFEHSPWVAEDAYERGPYPDRAALEAGLAEAMYGAPPDRQVALVRAHPDLAGKAAVAGTLTPDSEREQSSAGLDRLRSDEYEALTDANAAYRERFGFPFVVCVREHDKASILATAEARLQHDPEQEVRTALDEIAKIARLRLRDLP